MLSSDSVPEFSHQSELGKNRPAYARDVEDADLTRTANQIWGVLCDHINRKRTDNIVYPKIATIARRCKLTERSVQRGLKELREQHWICLPVGNAGGKQKANQYHLHPDGRPCVLPKVDLKRPGLKGDILSPFVADERVTNATAKGDKRDSAYKDRTSIVNIHRETSTTSRAREVNGGGEGGSLSVVKPSPQPNNFDLLELAEFERMEVELRRLRMDTTSHQQFERLMGASQGKTRPLLDGLARRRIKSAVSKAGFTISHFRYLFPWQTLGKANSPVGLLIKFSQEFGERAAGVNWPNCLCCNDSGDVQEPNSPWQGLGPCSCAAGDKVKQSKYQHFDAWRAAVANGTAFCAKCGNTGRTPDVYERDKTMSCSCHAGKAEHLRRQREIEEEQVRRQRANEEERMLDEQRKQQLKSEHVCPSCAGERKNGWCGHCNNTGMWYEEHEWSATGKCWVCCGTGQSMNSRLCERCAGTGQESSVSPCRKSSFAEISARLLRYSKKTA